MFVSLRSYLLFTALSVICYLAVQIQAATVCSSKASITEKFNQPTRTDVKSRRLAQAGRVTIRRVPYRGWQDAIVISNGTVEAVIVPSINRVMQFRFPNEEGVFWENDELAGDPVDAESKSWKNFGGDKTWVAPQSDWQAITNRKTPTVAFDAKPAEAVIKDSVVELISQSDEHYGIRARRFISLDAEKPLMTIRTVYEKLAGESRRVSVWVITQVKDPLGIFIPVPSTSKFAAGYMKLKNFPPTLKVIGGVLTLTRDATANHKIGSDSDVMIWVGARHVLRIDAARRIEGAEYPDGGSSVEIYTSQDPLAYVELETLSPLKTMRVGDTLTATNTYTLKRRTMQRVEEEANHALKQK